MALPLEPGLTPAEVSFLCENEPVTVIPRQRLDSMELIGGTTQVLQPPHRARLPLWLALLLKRQRRASIVVPFWMQAGPLQEILERETSAEVGRQFTPSASHGFAMERDSTLNDGSDTVEENLKLPFYWHTLSTHLLAHAADDVPDVEQVRRLLRDLREVRMAKMRGRLVDELQPGAGINVAGIGDVEVLEGRTFLTGVIDGLRKIHASREQAFKDQTEEDEMDTGLAGREDDEDEEMLR